MTTVGYGDVFAISYFGRVVSIVNAIWGAFIISCLVATLSKVSKYYEYGEFFHCLL